VQERLRQLFFRWWSQSCSTKANQLSTFQALLGIGAGAGGCLLFLRGIYSGHIEPASIGLAVGGVLLSCGVRANFATAVIAAGAAGCGEWLIGTAILLFAFGRVLGSERLSAAAAMALPILSALSFFMETGKMGEGIVMIVTASCVVLFPNLNRTIFVCSSAGAAISAGAFLPVALGWFLLPAGVLMWSRRMDEEVPEERRGGWAGAGVTEFFMAQMGDWRGHLTVAGMGWAMYQNWLILAGNDPLLSYAIWTGPASTMVLCLLGTASIFLGCRPGLLLAMAGAGLWNLLESWSGAHPYLWFIGEEYILWFVFPAGLFTLCILGRKMTALAFSNSARLYCFILLAGTSGFAALAKLNEDFFDPSVSCMSLAHEISQWWQTGQDFSQIPPWLVIAGEMAPVLIGLFSAPLAIIVATCFAQGLGAVGPLGINAAIIALTLGLFRRSDLHFILKGKRIIVGVVAGFVLFGLPVSQSLYLGERPWYQFAFFQTVCVAVLCAAGLVLAGRVSILSSKLKRGGIDRFSQARVRKIRGDWSGMKDGKLTAFFCILAALVIFNGLCPYLGLKFRCSFAMLSNLRVDRERWNHFFMPKWMLSREHDPYVKVLATLDGHFDGRDVPRGKKIRAGLMYSPDFFARAALARQQKSWRTHLRIKWMGVEGVFDSNDPVSHADFIKSLPQRGIGGDGIWQECLTIGGEPQFCIH